MPWLKLSLGFIPCALIVCFSAWFSNKTGNILIKALIWALTAVILSYLSRFVAFQGAEEITRKLQPELAEQVNYFVSWGIQARYYVILVMSIVLLLISGVMLDSIGEAVRSSGSFLGALIPVLFFLAFFAGAGYTSDNNFNYELRTPIKALDDQIQIVSELNTKNLDEKTELLFRSYAKLGVDLDGPRRLMLSTFDNFFTQVDILVDFSGTWVKCTVINERPSFCKTLE